MPTYGDSLSRTDCHASGTDLNVWITWSSPDTPICHVSPRADAFPSPTECTWVSGANLAPNADVRSYTNSESYVPAL